MQEENTKSEYIIGEKEDLILVLFQGKLTGRELPMLEQCETELKTKSQKIVIFNFRDVGILMPAVHIILAKIQKDIRDSGKFLGLCSLKPDIKKALLLAGIIREPEIFNNIPEAWEALRSKIKKES